MLKNTPQKFGLITRLLHWVSALTILGVFGLGYWMVDLDYYNQWYQQAPYWHESIGVLLCLLTLFRLVWRLFTPQPLPLVSHSRIIRAVSKVIQVSLYVLLFVIFISGYLVPTADGSIINVFGWFNVPSMGLIIEQQEDIAGSVHKYGAYVFIAFAVFHSIAALKHHFMDKDLTLSRML